MNTKQPFAETDNVDHPVSLYAATKKANELMGHSYAHLFSIPMTGLRYFTVYGPWGRPDMSPIKFAKAIFAGQPFPVFNEGRMICDFTYIDDITEGDDPRAGPGRRKASLLTGSSTWFISTTIQAFFIWQVVLTL